MENDREVSDRAGLRRGWSIEHEIGKEVRMRICEDNFVIELVHDRLESRGTCERQEGRDRGDFFHGKLLSTTRVKFDWVKDVNVLRREELKDVSKRTDLLFWILKKYSYSCFKFPPSHLCNFIWWLGNL